MKIEESIQKVYQILKLSNGSGIEECIEFIRVLAEIGCRNYENEVHEAFDDFLNHETINYVSDSKLYEINLHKWSKESIVEWLQKHGLNKRKEGIYNDNALVVAMNHEYTAHRNFVESTGNPPMTSYQLAKEALEQEDYIKRII